MSAGLREIEPAASEAIPKISMVAPPQDDEHTLVRYFTPQTPHNSLAVTGGAAYERSSQIFLRGHF